MQQTGYYDQMKNRLNRYHGNKEYKESLIFKNVFVWYLLSLFVIEFTTFSSYSLWSFCLLRASNRKEKAKHIKLILCEELALLSVYMILNGIFEVFRWRRHLRVWKVVMSVFWSICMWFLSLNNSLSFTRRDKPMKSRWKTHSIGMTNKLEIIIVKGFTVIELLTFVHQVFYLCVIPIEPVFHWV